MLTQVIPVLVVVVFWIIAFIFAFWFSQRALRAPIQEEHPEHPEHPETSDATGDATGDAANGTHEDTAAPVDGQVPSRPTH